MKTGIFIRAEIDGKWESVDIGDERVPDEDVLYWLRSRGGRNPWSENCVLLLLGRKPIAHKEEIDEGNS